MIMWKYIRITKRVEETNGKEARIHSKRGNDRKLRKRAILARIEDYEKPAKLKWR